jgi:hypothetical protein
VHEQQHDEAEREPPAPDEAVGGDRYEHRPRRRQDLQLRQQQQDDLDLRRELGDQQPERGNAAAAALPPRLALASERVVGGLGFGRALGLGRAAEVVLARRVGVGARREPEVGAALVAHEVFTTVCQQRLMRG